MNKYVDTGKVRYVTRHFAFLGDASVKAAEASECAAEQGKFWQYREAVYKNQAGLRGAGAAALLTRLAAEVGLEQGQFRSCLDSGRYTGAVKAEAREADAAGVRSTPTIIVDGVVVKGGKGVPTAEELNAAIDGALAKKGR